MSYEHGFFAKDAQIVAILEVKAIFPIATSQSSGNRLDFKKVVFFFQLASVCQMCKSTEKRCDIRDRLKRWPKGF